MKGHLSSTDQQRFDTKQLSYTLRPHLPVRGHFQRAGATSRPSSGNLM